MHARIDSARDVSRPEDGLDGMSEPVRAILRDALSAPSGIILFAGPSGSGRSRTLDAALARPQEPHVSIAGEIADKGSAVAAVQAALAGRLVLATVRADDAVAAVALVRALHGEPSLVAATLRAALAQRRLNRLCAQCRHPVQASAQLSALLGFDPGAIVWQAEGCPACSRSGHDGTIGLFEAVSIDSAMRRLIGGAGDAAILANHAFRDGPNLGAAARALAREGKISGEDAVRLSRTQCQ